MNKMINNDIENINKFLNKRPNIIGCYCYGIGESFNKKIYRLIIVTDDIWKWQKNNKNKGEFTIYSNMIYNDGFDFIDYIGIKEDNCIFDYTLMSGSEFINDLLHWKNYIFASIFQEIVIPIKSNNRLDSIIKRNRDNSLVISLLKLDKEKTSFFDAMVNYYSLLDGLSNNVVTFVNNNYNRLKATFGSSKYFKIDNSDNLVINTNLVKQDIIYLPRKIKEIIIKHDTTIDIENVINYLKNRYYLEKSYIDDMRFLANGALKTISYNSRNNKIKCLSR